MTLAINGGPRVRSQDFPAWPQFDHTEEEALLRSLRQGQWWRVSGKENTAFESEYAHYHGAPFAVTVTNGTVALELALQAAGIQPGDEVIVPAFTFVSTSMACQRVGAIAVPADVRPDSYGIDPEAVRRKITDRTRAIIPVHLSGHFCDMTAVMAIAEAHGLVVIQDAAHANGARGEGGKRIGDWHTLACFSFQNFKLMTAGEGGLVLCPTEELRDRVYLYSNCGRPAGDRSYNHTVVGTNGRLNEFSAAVLRAQLARLAQQSERREANARLLSEVLAAESRVTVQGHTAHATQHPHYMYMLTLNPDDGRVPDRNRIVDCLIAEGIPAYRAYQALYRIPSFWLAPAPSTSQAQLIAECPVTEHIAAQGIWIHHRALLGSVEDTLDIARAITKVLG
ncbi:DegT/DnrJ/EryC1/StrS family aminotransferase [Roseateles amylovorans]|uniref:DegT/DnrJ/EryC1/StrS family aminotransferase n=1 Tax=Roseateles amylovorans TaxID=2978473 RepID=A0ABY6ASW4_9BURK|nr:DegT/DnrJ/EryC1/StrS family aminotransferase [Roseateles amylovorans]UXH76107.1 DegT/DnrJ/EryC1/StrS family aminotransferase [Roseateles amylovorans]